MTLILPPGPWGPHATSGRSPCRFPSAPCAALGRQVWPQGGAEGPASQRGEVWKLSIVASPGTDCSLPASEQPGSKTPIAGLPRTARSQFLGMMGLTDGIFNMLPRQFLALRNWRAVAVFGEELGDRAWPLCWAVGASPLAEWFLLRDRKKLYR